jgi:lipoprotein-releasing system permease protein
MFQPVSLFIGLRYSRSRNRSGFVSFITFFSIAGILLGVASLITVVSVMNGFESELKKRILGIVPHIIITSENKNGMENWQSSAGNIMKLTHVQQVTPIISAEAMVQSASGLRGVLMHGINPELEQQNIIAQHMTIGEMIDLSHKLYSVIIGQSLAQSLNVNVGDKIRLVLPNKTRFTPMGRLPVQRLFDVVGIFNVGSQVDDSVIYTSNQSAIKLLRLPANNVTELRLYLDDAFNAKQVLPQLSFLPRTLQATSWQHSQGALFSAVHMEKNMMWLMLSLIIAVAAFNIVSALVMVVIDKQGEIGILQTLGLDRLSIIKIFMTQGMFNGVIGTTLGSFIGLLLTFYINDILAIFSVNLLGGYSNQQLPIVFQLSDLFIIVVGALLMTLCASLYPAYRASQTQPAEVLRNE